MNMKTLKDKTNIKQISALITKETHSKVGEAFRRVSRMKYPTKNAYIDAVLLAGIKRVK